MKIIEEFLSSKTPRQSDCEDSIFVSEDFAAVIDGVTSTSTRKYAEETPGKACSQLLKKTLKVLPYKSTAKQMVEYLTSAVYSMYKELGIEEEVTNLPAGRACASIVMYSRFRNEIWMVGDCQCLVDGTYHSNTKPIDTLISNIRSLFIQTELKLGKSYDDMLAVDTGRAFILPLLEWQPVFQNSPIKNEFTHGVINGFKVPQREIKVIKLSDPKQVILASDGYPCLFETLAKSERYLKKILKDDPLCFREFKTTKGLKPGNVSFDDRAYLKVAID
jgi:glycerophosphoryl diester phosphodiesterase